MLEDLMPLDRSTAKQKILALVVMVFWVAALVVGRLIAYIFKVVVSKGVLSLNLGVCKLNQLSNG
jgi:hypothetical protein